MSSFEEFIKPFPIVKKEKKFPPYDFKNKEKKKKNTFVLEFIEFWEFAGGKSITLKQKTMILSAIEELPYFTKDSLVYVSPSLKTIWHYFNKNKNIKLFPEEELQNNLEVEKIHVAIVEASLGISEKGAIGIEMNKIPNRSLLFLTEHLIFILDKKHIYPDFESINQKWKTFITNGGYLISGPSKTADIEQALVMGAHGPLTSTVILY